MYLEEIENRDKKLQKIHNAESFYMASIGMESKQGNKKYRTWIKELIEDINEDKTVKKETLFERVKRIKNVQSR